MSTHFLYVVIAELSESQHLYTECGQTGRDLFVDRVVSFGSLSDPELARF
jgi:hypothetical protein